MTFPIIFNITFKLSQEIADKWLNDMTKAYLPVCTDKKIVLSSKVCKILEGTPDGDITFAVQFTFPNKEVFEKEKLNAMRKFLNLLDSDYRGQYVYFATTMEQISHH